MVELATQYGRYGYRMVAALLREEGFAVNHKRVERLWRREGLKVPKKQPKRRRLWLNDGSCLRLRPSYKDHVWAYDFVTARTSDGRALRLPTLVVEGLALHRTSSRGRLRLPGGSAWPSTWPAGSPARTCWSD
jgi:transposase InsO family protein